MAKVDVSWIAHGAGVVLASVLVIGLAGCGGGGAASESGGADAAQIAAGKARFQRTCATCHGKEAEGMEGLGRNLHDNEFVESKTDAELVEFLKVGRSAWDPLNITGVDMPPKGGDPTLTEEDMRDIVAYLRSIQ